MTAAEKVISIIVGSTRRISTGKDISKCIQGMIAQIAQDGNLAVHVDEYTPLEPFNLLVEPINQLPPMLINTASGDEAELLKYESAVVREYSLKMQATDAFVFVLPVYNHSYPGGFKIMMDHIFSELKNKPVYIVGYGSSEPGVDKCVAHTLELVTKLGMIPLSATAVAQRTRPYTSEDAQEELHSKISTLLLAEE